MEWNFKEELVRSIRQRVDPGNGTAETTYYQYDGQGQRIRKITENQAAPGNTPTKKEERIYIAGYELYKQHSGNDAGLERVSLSLMDKGHRFVMVETRNNIDDGTEKQLVRYQLHNHLGSSALELDLNAEVISYEEYHPFGTTAFQANNAAIKSTAKRYRYTGMERDEETGLEYHSARYYLPWLGRWLNADPIGIGDGLNIYQYGRNNPIFFADSTGTQGEVTLEPVNIEVSRKDIEIEKKVEEELRTKGPFLFSLEYNMPLSDVKLLEEYLGFSDVQYPESPATDGPDKLEPNIDNRGQTPQQKFDQAMAGIEGLRRPAGNTGLAPAAAIVLAPAAESAVAARIVSTLGRPLAQALSGAGIVLNFGITVEGPDDPDIASATAVGVLGLQAFQSKLTLNIGGELDTLPGQVVINPGRDAMPISKLRSLIPNKIIEAGAEAVPLESGVADFIVGRKLPNSIDWTKAASEFDRLLVPGGKVNISVYGPADKLAAALKAKGFVNVEVKYGVQVTATKK